MGVFLTGFHTNICLHVFQCVLCVQVKSKSEQLSFGPEKSERPTNRGKKIKRSKKENMIMIQPGMKPRSLHVAINVAIRTHSPKKKTITTNWYS